MTLTQIILKDQAQIFRLYYSVEHVLRSIFARGWTLRSLGKARIRALQAPIRPVTYIEKQRYPDAEIKNRKIGISGSYKGLSNASASSHLYIPMILRYTLP